MFEKLLEFTGADSEEEVLKWSVIYGWGLVGFGLFTILFLGITTSLPESIQPNLIMELITYLWLAAIVLFIFRYTSAKPILGATAAGISTITLAAILDSVTNYAYVMIICDTCFGKPFL